MDLLLQMRNLPPDVSPVDIRGFFHGIFIPEDGVRVLGGPDGDAFISFHTESDLYDALYCDGQDFCGYTVKLRPARQGDLEQVVFKIHQYQENLSRNQSRNRCWSEPHNEIDVFSPNAVERIRRYSSASASDHRHETNQTIQVEPGYVAVYHVPVSVTPNDIKNFFLGLDIVADDGIFMETNEELSCQTAYVKFENMHQAFQAQNLSAFPLCGQDVQVDIISENHFEHRSDSADEVLLRSSPFLSMFEPNPLKKQCYIGMWSLPSPISACEVLSWFEDVGKCVLGVTMGVDPEDPAMSMAFVVFSDVKSRLNAKSKIQHSRYYSANAAHDFLVGLGEGCTVRISTLSGVDLILSLDHRRQMAANEDVPMDEICKTTESMPPYSIASPAAKLYCYLELTQKIFNPYCVASSYWAAFGGMRGMCTGVTLVRDPRGNPVTAFIAFECPVQCSKVKHLLKDGVKELTQLSVFCQMATYVLGNYQICESATSGLDQILPFKSRLHFTDSYQSVPIEDKTKNPLQADRLSRPEYDPGYGQSVKSATPTHSDGLQINHTPPMHRNLYYLRLVKIPAGTTACSIHSTFSSDCHQIILLCNQANNPIVAFATFSDLAICLSSRVKYAYSGQTNEAVGTIARQSPDCPIWLSSETGVDVLMSEEERNSYKCMASYQYQLKGRCAYGRSLSNRASNSAYAHPKTENTDETITVKPSINDGDEQEMQPGPSKEIALSTPHKAQISKSRKSNTALLPAADIRSTEESSTKAMSTATPKRPPTPEQELESMNDLNTSRPSKITKKIKVNIPSFGVKR